MNPLFELTDDLTPSQFQSLLTYLWTGKYKVTLANIRGWRKRSLIVEEDDSDYIYKHVYKGDGGDCQLCGERIGSIQHD